MCKMLPVWRKRLRNWPADSRTREGDTVRLLRARHARDATPTCETNRNLRTHPMPVRADARLTRLRPEIKLNRRKAQRVIPGIVGKEDWIALAAIDKDSDYKYVAHVPLGDDAVAVDRPVFIL